MYFVVMNKRVPNCTQQQQLELTWKQSSLQKLVKSYFSQVGTSGSLLLKLNRRLLVLYEAMENTFRVHLRYVYYRYLMFCMMLL